MMLQVLGSEIQEYKWRSRLSSAMRRGNDRVGVAYDQKAWVTDASRQWSAFRTLQIWMLLIRVRIYLSADELPIAVAIPIAVLNLLCWG